MRGLLAAGVLAYSGLAQAAAPSQAEAARFLTQASFGPTVATIEDVQRLGYAGWIDDQWNKPASLHRPEVEGLLAVNADKTDQALRQEVWWRYAITAPDQLRQRVAFALSEIFVVSDADSQLAPQPVLLAEYYDHLVRGASGTYRTLLEQVTLSPAMGLYLSMIRNEKPDAETGRRPDENFAREVMQLFSIGLWQLNADGSDRLDGNGRRIPTYDQVTVENFARAFTGWTWADAPHWYGAGKAYAPMKAFEERHDTDPKVLLDGKAQAAGRNAAQDLAAALDSIAQHPNVGPFLARRLIQRLVTSNPSPAYVGRVASVFADNGAGTRGDLKSVVRAILLDPEARAVPSGTTQGKLREPILRMTALWRAFEAAAQNGKYHYPNPEVDFGQAALRSPSVFNFFQPDHSTAGPISDAGLRSPEFQLQTESHGVNVVNRLSRAILEQYDGGVPLQTGVVKIRIEREKVLASNPASLADHLDRLLLSGRMPAAMRQAVVEHVAAIPAEDTTQRALHAIFLVATSTEFAVQP